MLNSFNTFSVMTVELNEMEMLRQNLKLVNERVEKMEKMIEKLTTTCLKIEDEIKTESEKSYTPSSNESVDSLEFKEFSDEDIWETNKNENKECNECGSIDIEKDDMCEGDKYVFWCNECNCHVGASVNEKEKEIEDYSGEDFEWCEWCERFGCKCNESVVSCEGCRNDYLNQLGHMDPGGCLYELISNNYRKRNIDEIEIDSDDEIDVGSYAYSPLKRNKQF